MAASYLNPRGQERIGAGEEAAFRNGADARNEAINEALGGESVVKQPAEQTAQIFATASGQVRSIGLACGSAGGELVAERPQEPPLR